MVILGVSMSDSLRYLQAITEHGNLTRAASALFISQPALSRYISRLEESVGVRLVDRTAQPLTLTPEGHRYSDYLLAVSKLRTSMEADLSGMGQMAGETARLGTTGWRSTTLLPRVLPELLDHRPGLQINLYGLSNSDLLSGVRSKKLDLAVMYTGRAGIGVHFHKIADERVLLVGSAVKSLLGTAERGATVPVGQLKSFLQSQRLILMHPEHNLGAVSRDFLTRLGIRLRQVININSVVPMIDLAMSGTGVTFVPDSMANRPEYANVPFVRIQHADLMQEIGLAWPADAEPRGAIKDLADILTQKILSDVDQN